MPDLMYVYRMRSNVTTPDVTLTSHIPCSVNLLSEQEIVQSRNHTSEAARGQEKCDFWRPGRLLYRRPRDSFRPSSFKSFSLVRQL